MTPRVPGWDNIFDLAELLGQREVWVPLAQPTILIVDMPTPHLNNVISWIPDQIRRRVLDVIDDFITDAPEEVMTSEERRVMAQLNTWSKYPTSMPVMGAVEEEIIRRQFLHDCPLCGRTHRILNP